MKKIVLGTLFCLAACGEDYEAQIGTPEDHAVPELAPDVLGFPRANVLQSRSNRIRLSTPAGWELYHFPFRPGSSYFDYTRSPDENNRVDAALFHPAARVHCQVRLELTLTEPSEVSLTFKGRDGQVAWLELVASSSKYPEGGVLASWRHPSDSITPAPIYEIQSYYDLWGRDYPALGFGVSEVGDRWATLVYCYWIDGERGDNEFELLSDVRNAAQFIGVE